MTSRLFTEPFIRAQVTGLGAGNSPVTGESAAQKATNAENVSIWWHHHVILRHQATMM